MDPDSLKSLIEGSQVIYSARGGDKSILQEETQTKAFAFASVVAIKDINPGQILNYENIWVKRPSGGDFPAIELEKLFGKVAKKLIKKNHQIKLTDIL